MHLICRRYINHRENHCLVTYAEDDGNGCCSHSYENPTGSLIAAKKTESISFHGLPPSQHIPQTWLHEWVNTSEQRIIIPCCWLILIPGWALHVQVHVIRLAKNVKGLADLLSRILLNMLGQATPIYRRSKFPWQCTGCPFVSDTHPKSK